MLKIICCLLLFGSMATTAQTPIPRQGDSCPTGTYRSGDYCKQLPSSVKRSDTIIQKSGSDCPTRFYASGNYCKRIGSSGREAIPRDKGKDCPTGW